MLPSERGSQRGPGRGAQHPEAKLTERDVRRIRRLHDDGYSSTRLAQMFPVTDRHIRKLCRGEAWRHLEMRKHVY